MMSGNVDVDSEQFIAVPFRQLAQRLIAEYLTRAVDAQSATTDFANFCEACSVLVTTFYSRTTAPVKEYWCREASVNTQDDVEVVDVLHSLLRASQYAPLPNFETATESSFDFHFPIVLRTSRTDPELFSRWYQDNKIFGDSSAVPQLASHFFVWTRGASTAKKEGRFIMEKLDLLLEDYGGAVMRRLGGATKKTERPPPAGLSSPTSPQTSASQSQSASSSVFGQSHLNRVTLRDLVRLQGWRSLFRVSEIEEPVYSSVVVAYREKDERRFTATRHLVQVEQFSTVPFADLEAILPFKTVQLAPLDTVKFSVQVALLLSFAHISISELNAGDDDQTTAGFALLCVLLVGLLSRLIGLIYYYTSIVSYYEQELDEWLQKKREGRNAAVLSRLGEEVQLQETKEMVLAYFFLWRLGPLTLGDLDARIERFLEKNFGLKVDFDAEDAVSKLVAAGLVVPCEAELMSSFANGSFPGHLRGADRFEVLLQPSEWVAKHPVKHLTAIKLR